MTTSLDSYRAASHGLVVIDRSDRVRLDVSGPDRAKFLHNLTTNDVKRLAAGQGIEAFVTSPQGKTLGYVTLLNADDRLMVRTDPGGDIAMLPHLQKYGVFDDVAIDDIAPRTFEIHLAGPGAENALRQVGAELPEAGALRHVATSVIGRAVRVVRESPFGVEGLTILGYRVDLDTVRDSLRHSLAIDLDPATAEVLRIEAGTPVFGRDVTPDNLPQEIAHDDRTISFVKGCYLGQETVARIDALGHVNKILRVLHLEGDESSVPPMGATIEVEGKAVGAITSSAFSPVRGRAVALGYVRIGHAKAGTPVRVVAGENRIDAVVAD